MTEVLGLPPAMEPDAPDLTAEVRRVLEASPEPLTLSKIRSHLPAAQRGIGLDVLTEGLERLVDANVFYRYPAYRSQQNRYWDRPMTVHVAQLIRDALAEGPLPWSQLRRKLPGYALEPKDKPVADAVLKDLVEQGKLYKHPTPGSRTGERFGLTPPDPKEPLRRELPVLFEKLESLYGFSRAQLRVASISLLQEEEWGPVEPAPNRAVAKAAPPPPVEAEAPATDEPETAPVSEDADGETA
jgi:hypothetical protein